MHGTHVNTCVSLLCTVALSVVEPFVPNRSIVCVSNWTLSGAFVAAGQRSLQPHACLFVHCACCICVRVIENYGHTRFTLRNIAAMLRFVGFFGPVRCMLATCSYEHECSAKHADRVQRIRIRSLGNKK